MMRLALPLVVAKLLVLAGSVPSSAEAQELPRDALRGTLEYFQTTAAGQKVRLSVETKGFPDASVVEAVARSLGIHAGTGTEVRECDVEAHRCTLVGADKLLHLTDFEVTTPGREIKLLVNQSVRVEVEVEGEEIKRTAVALHLVTLRNDGGWRVVSDEPIVIG
jgi:hypothetical protein